jgi:hypothetical protein
MMMSNRCRYDSRVIFGCHSEKRSEELSKFTAAKQAVKNDYSAGDCVLMEIDK